MPQPLAIADDAFGFVPAPAPTVAAPPPVPENAFGFTPIPAPANTSAVPDDAFGFTPIGSEPTVSSLESGPSNIIGLPGIPQSTTDMLQRQMAAQEFGREQDVEGNKGFTTAATQGGVAAAKWLGQDIASGAKSQWETIKELDPSRLGNRLLGRPPETPYIPPEVSQPFIYAAQASAGDLASTLGISRKVGEGAGKAVSETGIGLANPDILIGGAAIKEGGLAAKLAKSAFAGQMASQVPQALEQTKQALQYGDESDIAHATANLAITAGIPLGMVKSEVDALKPKLPTGKMIPMPRGARPQPVEPVAIEPPGEVGVSKPLLTVPEALPAAQVNALDKLRANLAAKEADNSPEAIQARADTEFDRLMRQHNLFVQMGENGKPIETRPANPGEEPGVRPFVPVTKKGAENEQILPTEKQAVSQGGDLQPGWAGIENRPGEAGGQSLQREGGGGAEEVNQGVPARGQAGEGTVTPPKGINPQTAAATAKNAKFLASQGIEVDSFLKNPYDHITHISEQYDGSYEVRIEHHDENSVSSELVNVKPGESLSNPGKPKFIDGVGMRIIRPDGSISNPMQKVQPNEENVTKIPSAASTAIPNPNPPNAKAPDLSRAPANIHGPETQPTGPGRADIGAAPNGGVPVPDQPPQAVPANDVTNPPFTTPAKPLEAQGVAAPGAKPSAEAKPSGMVGDPRLLSDESLAGEIGPGIVPLGGDIGGAAGEAAEGRNGSPTAMKYKLIDQERQQRGEPPLAKPQGVSDKALMDKAMAETDKDPDYAKKLTAELLVKPHTIEDWQNVALMLRKIDLRNEYGKAVAETLRAYEDSKQFPDRRQDMVAAQLRRAEIGKELDDVERASRLAGNKAGSVLRSYQIMANEDYSLASLERDARAAKGGDDLTPDEQAGIKKLSDEHAKVTADLQAKLDASKRAEVEANARIAEIQRQVAAEPKIPPHVKVIADRLKGYFDARAAKAMKDLQGMSWSVGPEVILKLTDLGVSKILSGAAEATGWTAQMMADMKEKFGEKAEELRQHLPEVWEKANKVLDAEIGKIGRGADVKKVLKSLPVEDQIAGRSATIGKALTEGKKDSITWQVQQLARLFVRQGITGRDALVDAVHGVLQKADPSITRRETMDAISGYGDYKQLSKDDVSTRLRDLKGQLQQTAKLEDLQNRKPPLKSGVERRAPSDEERRLISQVEEAKRRYGVTITDPETQLKSALDARKTYYRNQIADFDAQIEKGERFIKTKTPVMTDVELEGLKAKRNAAKAEFDKMLTQDPAYQAEQAAKWLEQRKAAIQKDIADMEGKLKTGDIEPVGRQVNRPADPALEPLRQRRDELARQLAEARQTPESEKYAKWMENKLAQMNKEIEAREKKVAARDTSPMNQARVNRPLPPEIEQARQRLDALNDQINQLRHPEKTPLDLLKRRLQTRIAELQEKLANQDFTTKPRQQIELDPEVQQLQARKNTIEQEWRSKKARWELEHRPNMEKTADWFSNARRFAVLSGTKVLMKLAAYSATRVPTMALADVVGGVWSKVPGISQIAARAPSEGTFRPNLIARAIAKGMTKGMMDAYQTATTGQSELKGAFSTRLDLGFHWYNVPQIVHEVIKSPLRRVAFEDSLARRIEFAARGGADVSDPMTQLVLAKDAYLDSDRALMLENNRLATGIRNIIKQWEQPDKATGEVPLHGKIASTAGRIELPILTVPMNYVKQSLTASFGLISGSIKARAAFRRGIDNLTPEEADSIMRHLKYGTIGGAMMLYGFYDGYHNADDESKSTFGGFYQPGEKRKEDQAGVGGAKIMGMKIPGLLLHNPVIAVGQLGHTIGAIAASKLNKKSLDRVGIPIAAVAGMIGLLNESPMGRPIELVSNLSDYRDRNWAAGEHLKGLIAPQGAQEIAEWTDRDAQGNPVKRKPETISQHIETGFPGLREQVPATSSKTPTQKFRDDLSDERLNAAKLKSAIQARADRGETEQQSAAREKARINAFSTNTIAGASQMKFNSLPLPEMEKVYEGGTPAEKAIWKTFIDAKQKKYSSTNTTPATNLLQIR